MEYEPSKPRLSRTSRTTDPEMFANAMRGAELQPCQLGDPAPSAYARLECPRVSLDLASLGTAMSFSGKASPDCYSLAFATACPRTGVSLTFGIEHTDGYLGVVPPGGAVAGVKPAGYRQAVITVPTSDFLEAISRHAPELPDQQLTHGAALRAAPADHAVLRGLLSELEEKIWNEPASFARAATRRAAEADLLAAYLGALRHGGGEAVTSAPRLARRYERLRRAMDFINAHAHEPIHLDDLCVALGLSRRGVEYLFHDLLDVSPVVYLRHRRLHRARRDLELATPGPGQVKRAALDWGFWHLGRFAREYRLLFGELPGDTLKTDPAQRTLRQMGVAPRPAVDPSTATHGVARTDSDGCLSTVETGSRCPVVRLVRSHPPVEHSRPPGDTAKKTG